MFSKKITGSKSIINRLLTLALYHDKEISIKNINLCHDVMEMLNIYKKIGKIYTISKDTLFINTITSPPSKLSLHIKESGTCLRFVLPYLAFSRFQKANITLGERLSQRPIKPLIDCLNDSGANIMTKGNKIIITGQDITNKDFHIDSSESSQFISSLLMLKSVHHEININGKAQSDSYVKMTNDVISYFHEKEFILDPDYSTACYYWFNSYLLKKFKYIKKIGKIHHPDYYFINIMQDLGIKFIEKADYISVDVSSDMYLTSSKIIDMSDMPDQIITLVFMALSSGLFINISGCETLYKKESDRITGIIENCKLLGGNAEYKDGLLTITPFKNTPNKCMLKTYNDHRFALTFLVLQKKYKYLEIDDVKCITKSVILNSKFSIHNSKFKTPQPFYKTDSPETPSH